ncbi:DoxX family protein [Pelagibacterium xiamenense]|uniref:DoxX family protein n=1 Tax=Pelagibacterium xiamenense TaxID=2901140 RepID=UPI001E448730|nr:DoxX family protein [Pelagibacterium xiamenense]MCD7059036.1 DoxX family protein [Pelagibacterium xiamenense]
MTAVHSFRPGLIGLVQRADALLGAIPLSLSLLALRVALAVPFFRSGLTKWDGFLDLSASARLLFAQHFKLHIFGAAYAYPFPGLMAWVTAIAEIVLPILLVLGLFTRFSALGILLMTAVIQLTVPDGWANFHLPWAAMALALVTLGGGKIAADRVWKQGT